MLCLNAVLFQGIGTVYGGIEVEQASDNWFQCLDAVLFQGIGMVYRGGAGFR